MAKVKVRPRFVARELLFDPAVDLKQVEQFGFVNLGEAFEKGIIPSTIDETDLSYNSVSNPGTLISRSQDVFDATRKSEYVRRTLESLELSKREKEAAEKAAAAASAAAGVPGSSQE